MARRSWTRAGWPWAAALVAWGLGPGAAVADDAPDGGPTEPPATEPDLPPPAADPVWEELQELRRRVAELEDAQAREEESEDADQDTLRETIRELAGRVHLSGYAVAGYDYARRPDSSLRPLLREHQFRAGDLSVYLRAELPADFSTSVQILFQPRPQDNVLPKDEELEIERAFVQWAPAPQFKVKLGKFITPVGYWTYLVHDEPLLPTLTTPLVIRNRVFDEESVGVVVEGEQTLGAAVRLGYAAWLSNGETLGRFSDDNNDKAAGGRIYFAGETLGAVEFYQVGISGYFGVTEGAHEFVPGDPRLRRVAEAEGRAPDYFTTTFESQGLTPWGQPIGGSSNRAVAADVVLDLYGLRLRAEAMINWVIPRSSDQPRPSHFVEWGAYCYLGYALPLPQLEREGAEPLELGTLEPYVRYDVYDGNGDYVHELQSLSLISVGLNYLVNEYVQIRLENTWYRYRDHARDFYGVQAGVVASF